MPSDKDADALKQQRLTYTTLIGLFWTVFGLFNLRDRKKEVDLRPFDLITLGLAVARLGRLVAFDRVTEPLRAPFTETVPDPSGAGETVEPKGKGWRRAFGEMIACPVCVGTWIAAALVYGLSLLPRPTRLFVAIMGAIGLGELLNALVEALSWTAQAARREAGDA